MSPAHLNLAYLKNQCGPHQPSCPLLMASRGALQKSSLCSLQKLPSAQSPSQPAQCQQENIQPLHLGPGGRCPPFLAVPPPGAHPWLSALHPHRRPRTGRPCLPHQCSNHLPCPQVSGEALRKHPGRAGRVQGPLLCTWSTRVPSLVAVTGMMILASV